MEKAKVRCVHTQGSGCYGHNMADDAGADAALLAAAVPGKSVKLQYTRAQEHQWEPYGSAMVVKIKAGLDGEGNVLDWNPRTKNVPMAKPEIYSLAATWRTHLKCPCQRRLVHPPTARLETASRFMSFPAKRW
jgi:hypothetical protein